jgi:putative tryptophan/tyrosine transport system substrate-binding protein
MRVPLYCGRAVERGTSDFNERGLGEEVIVRRSCAWIVAVVGVLLMAPLAVPAQQPAGEMPRIGVLVFTPMAKAVQEGFRQGFRDYGYVEGQNIFVEWRSADGSTERANAVAAEFVRLKVNVIVAEFTPAVQAAKNATQTIPIVMASAGDPVATGLVASLARPGGNITGLSNIAAELSGKRFELLRDLIPAVMRVGLLIHGDDPLDKTFVAETQTAATKAGIQLQVVSVSKPEQLDRALSRMVNGRVGAVIVPANLPVPAHEIAQSALRHRLPTISLLSQYPESGGLMSYGASLIDIRRQAIGYVDKILRGAKPADLPVERPTTFELVINRRTAQTLGLTVPPSVLLRADRVID